MKSQSTTPTPTLTPTTRRQAMLTLGVLGFNAAAGGWVTAAQAQAASAPHFHALPPLDGSVHLDEATLADYARDFGEIVQERPLAVLKPGSVLDIARMLGFAGRHGIRVVGRGRGHTVFGQSQVQAGIVIDISTLSAVHRLDAHSIEVDAGIRWNTLLKATLDRGLMPPALTDFIGQTVGGTLSVGGIGGMTHRQGAQVDHVLALRVVTGAGRIVDCSPTERRDLFEAVLAGQGQVGLIVRATLKLVPAPTRIRVFNLVYFSLAALAAEAQALVADERFEFMEAFGFRQPDGSWVYLLQAGAYYTPPTLPDDAALLAGLNDARQFMTIEDTGFGEFAGRVPELPRQPHPWIDLILPVPGIEAFMAQVEQTLAPLEAGDSFSVLLIPMVTRRFTRPLFKAPASPLAFGFGILRSMAPGSTAVAQAVAYNRSLFDHCRSLGGTHYPISAVALAREDWVAHYGAQFPALAAAKRRHDPANVLTGGPNMF
jgi:cytokinin dehydrogenase